MYRLISYRIAYWKNLLLFIENNFINHIYIYIYIYILIHFNFLLYLCMCMSSHEALMAYQVLSHKMVLATRVQIMDEYILFVFMF